MTSEQQRDWIWSKYEEVRDMSYDMACADAEQFTREAAEKLLCAHRALVASAKSECTGPEQLEGFDCRAGFCP